MTGNQRTPELVHLNLRASRACRPSGQPSVRSDRRHESRRAWSAFGILPPWTSTSSTEPTSCSAISMRCRRPATRRAWRSARCAAWSRRCSGLINRGATHVGVATDHVIESFRNRMWPGYKTGAGVDPDLLSQFGLLEEALTALGVVVWPMVEEEADDALAAAARIAAEDAAVRAGVDLHAGQGSRAVRARDPGRAVASPRRTRSWTRPGWWRSSACRPASIPDYLALVGDAADGYPGLPGLGREVGGRGAGEVRPHRGDSGRPADVARQRRQLGRAGADAGARPARWCCCFASWRRCAPTCRCSSRSRSCAGRVRRRRSSHSPRDSTAAVMGPGRRGR